MASAILVTPNLINFHQYLFTEKIQCMHVTTQDQTQNYGMLTPFSRHYTTTLICIPSENLNYIRCICNCHI